MLEGSELVHYFHDHSDSAPWQRAQIITTTLAAPGSIIQSSLGSDGNNFESSCSKASELVHYFHDNSDVTTPWQRAQVITQPRYRSRLDHPEQPRQQTATTSKSSWRRVAVEPPTTGMTTQTSLRPGETANRWRSCRSCPFTLRGRARSSRRRAKTTASACCRPTTKPTSRFGIAGTDLGASFLAGGRLYFLFGDTSWTRPAPRDADSIAFSTDPIASDGVDLRFNPTYPYVPGISQGAFEVPLDGVGVDGTPNASGPGWIIQSGLGSDGNNFEVVVLEGSELVHYFHDNSDVTSPGSAPK